jgi:hypothetical protein
MAEKALARKDDAEIQAYSMPLDVEAMSYADIVSSGDFITLPGFNLTDKEDLLGVPMFIVKIVYQEAGFVSVHAVTKDAAILADARAKGRLIGDKIGAEERVVFNDGSTGIRRQLTKLLHNWGLLNVGKPDSEGDSRFDTEWQEWADFSQSEKLGSKADSAVVPSFTRAPSGRQLVISSDYGLYASRYQTQGVEGVKDGTDAVTYYLR